MFNRQENRYCKVVWESEIKLQRLHRWNCALLKHCFDYFQFVQANLNPYEAWNSYFCRFFKAKWSNFRRALFQNCLDFPPPPTEVKRLFVFGFSFMQCSIFQNFSELSNCLLSLSLEWFYIKIKLLLLVCGFFTFCTSEHIYPLSLGDFFTCCRSLSCFVKIVVSSCIIVKDQPWIVCMAN